MYTFIHCLNLGNILVEVPHPIEGCSESYRTRSAVANRHNLNHEYGKLRLDLAKHVLEELLKLEEQTL